MTKRLKFDENGDSSDLQALFDSIAAGPAKSKLEVVTASATTTASATASAGGDDDELQSLFDAVAAEFETAADDGRTVAAPAAPAGADAGAAPHSCEAVFNRIGHMTRQVYDTLRALGCDDALHEAVQAIPDARQRLNYIAQMTEQAASRVLNATDIAQPIQNKVQSDAAALQGQWDKLFANQLSVDEFKALASQTRGFLGEVQHSSRATNEQLLEIMMAQDFQDLTGQVIKKVVGLAQTLESELLAVLIEIAPAEKRSEHAGLLNGPVVSQEGRDDVVSSQQQVDDLLDSLGF